MTDSLRFIFKTLIKIPFFIMVIYFIANIFFFSLFYFKFTGISYSVMNTGMENNYIPPSELATLKNTVEKIDADSDLIQGAKIVVDGSNQRKQYGTPITVGVEYRYRWLTPLMPQDTGQRPADLNSGSSIVDDSTASEGNINMSQAEAQRRIDELSNRSLNSPIQIIYKVPGLQYYPDLN